MSEILNKLLAEHGQNVWSIRNKPSGSVYIGRGSIFGNPYRMTKESERIQVCEDFITYCEKRVKEDEVFRASVKSLHGKNVHCYCSNGTTSLENGARYCHGHALLSIAKRLNE